MFKQRPSGKELPFIMRSNQDEVYVTNQVKFDWDHNTDEQSGNRTLDFFNGWHNE